MKKIIIVSHCMEIGGAERALIGLLSSIDYSEYRVDLFLLRHVGEFMKLIPEEVNLLPQKKEYSALAIPIERVIKRGQFNIAFGRFLGKYRAYSFKKKKRFTAKSEDDIAIVYSHLYTKAYMPKISDEIYDLGISFLTPHYFVIDKVDAKCKIAWIHTDYSFLEVDVTDQLKMWVSYDKIISISDKVTEGFLSKFPSLGDKILLIENILSSKFVREQAAMENVSNEIPNQNGIINLLSIGRFTYLKNFSNVPDICRYITDKGIKIKWYLIGFGSEEQLIRDKIKEANMENNVIILGKKPNPYPYIKACDIYVQPSMYEGKAVAVREAQILLKPVVITAFPTSQSQLDDGVDGVIVPIENEKCAEGIVKLINDREFQDHLISNMKSIEYSNGKEVEKLYNLIDN